MAAEAVRQWRTSGSCQVAFILAFALSTTGCSLLLDFGEARDGGAEDADIIDAGPVGDGGDPCVAYEPNDSFNKAVPIEPGTHAPLAICPGGDHDFFSFTIADNQDVVVEALFANMGGAGDLEMRLYNGSGEIIDLSETFTDNERIERSMAQSNQLLPGTYAVEMRGYNASTENEYSLVLTVTTP